MLYGDTNYERHNEPNSPYYENPCGGCRRKCSTGCEFIEQEIEEVLDQENVYDIAGPLEVKKNNLSMFQALKEAVKNKPKRISQPF